MIDICLKCARPSECSVAWSYFLNCDYVHRLYYSKSWTDMFFVTRANGVTRIRCLSCMTEWSQGQ